MYRLFHYLIVLVWLVNGLFCKVLLLVPRHAAIVASILGPTHAEVLTRLIGLGEIIIALWVLSRWQPRWCVAVQIVLVLSMNTLEALLAPDLLLWGRANAVFAALFCLLLYLHGGRPARPSAS